MSPEDRALRQAIEALAFEGVLRPVRGGWTVGDMTIRAPHRLQDGGRVRLLDAPLDDAGRTITIGALGRGLAAEGYDASALLLAVRRSAHFLGLAGPVPTGRVRLTGRALEAALIEGHPYHPGFKARIGFSDEDNAAFGAEAAAPFRPLWLAVDPALVERRGSDIASGFARPMAVPVHPWQWARLQDDAAIRSWLSDGRLRLLEPGPAMQATASLRTLAPLDGGDHLKLSLAVGVTSSIRDLVPWSVTVAPAISAWLERVVAADPALRGLEILPEHGAAIVARDLLGGGLAAIRRTAPPDDAVPVSALSLTDGDGSLLIASWLARHGTRAWTARLLQVLRPIWHLMTHHGIALEAHGQNLLLRHQDGWPMSVVARDFSESLEYVPDCLARPDLAPDLASILPDIATAPPGTYHRMASASDLRDLVMDCLVTHVLADLAHLLHSRDLLPEPAFWALARAAFPPAPGFATDAPDYPAESLASRLLGVTATHPVPNPLKAHPMPQFFRLNDRLIKPSDLALPDLPGDPDRTRVALHLSDKAACLALILRLRAAGASCHPIHVEMPADQARDLARRSGCNLLVHDDGVSLLGQDAPLTPGGVLVQTSSGTTGAPRIIARSWASIQTEIDAYRQALPQAADMTPVIAAPITHSYGLIAGVLVGLARGHVPVVLDSANPRTVLRLLADVPAPLLYAAPPLLHVLARLAGPQGLHSVMSSGTVLPQPWFDAIRGSARHLFQQYGCSETGCVAIATDPGSPQDMGAPLPHVRLIAGRDAPAPVEVRGAGGPVATGDLGIIDARGHLIFKGRAAEVIDVAGINVYPAQIEAAALAMPGVADAVAFAIPDASAGQRPALAWAGDVPKAALDAHLATALSPRQRPVRLFHLPSLPRGANGKIARRNLAATLMEPAP